MTAVDTDRILELADTTPEAMFELFEEHGWGDGLPLVPPTTERVEAMLEYAEGDVDQEFGVLAPRSGVVTRRIVAINAVLAGCKPEYFPVVFSARARARAAGAEPPWRERDHASGVAVAHRVRRHRTRVRVQLGCRGIRPGQPRQRDRRAGRPPAPAPRRGCAPGLR